MQLPFAKIFIVGIEIFAARRDRADHLSLRVPAPAAFAVGQGVGAARNAFRQPQLRVVTIGGVGKAAFAHAGEFIRSGDDIAVPAGEPANSALTVIDHLLFALFQHLHQICILRYPAALHARNMLLHAQHDVVLFFIEGDVSYLQNAAGIELPKHALLRIDIFAELAGDHLSHRAFRAAAQHNPAVAAGDGFTVRSAGGGPQRGRGEQRTQRKRRNQRAFHGVTPRDLNNLSVTVLAASGAAW